MLSSLKNTHTIILELARLVLTKSILILYGPLYKINFNDESEHLRRAMQMLRRGITSREWNILTPTAHS